MRPPCPQLPYPTSTPHQTPKHALVAQKIELQNPTSMKHPIPHHPRVECEGQLRAICLVQVLVKLPLVDVDIPWQPRVRDPQEG